MIDESQPTNSSTELPIVDSAEEKLPSILGLDVDALAKWCGQHGQAGYRAKQIYKWLFTGRVNSFDEMKDLPKVLREELNKSFRIFPSEQVAHQISKDKTEKYLLKLDDGQHVETVLMRETSRRTVCISTQVGCGMGCVFCASGMLGLKRNLTTPEILQQILLLDRRLKPDERLTNIVVMGIGEPLANLKSLLPALRAVQDDAGLGLGARRITVSTVGLPEKIQQLADYGQAYNLAISLHAPNNQLRDKIVPVNDRIGIKKLLEAAEYYFDKTGRRVTYEYVLLDGVNDQAEHAKQLADLMRGRNAHVNLIPMNSVDELGYSGSTSINSQQFADIAGENGLAVTIRKRKGEDIDAACGQLRLKEDQKA